MTAKFLSFGWLRGGLLLFAFFLLFPLWGLGGFSLHAQNIGTYKFIITPTDTCHSSSVSILEVNKQYYLLSILCDYPFSLQKNYVVIIFDEDLNQINQIDLDGGNIDFKDADYGWFVKSLFYEKNYFYVLGGGADTFNAGYNRFFLAKYTEDFILTQPISIYTLPDTLLFYRDTLIHGTDTFIYADSSSKWELSSMFMTSKSEFIVHFRLSDFSLGKLFHIDTNGTILHEMYVSPFGGGGVMVETDKYYIMANGPLMTGILLYPKDSLENYKRASLESSGWSTMESAVAVGNQLIQDNYFINKTCGFKDYRSYPKIVFFDENFKRKKELILGDTCFGHRNAEKDGLHYLNPDSIYYAYTSDSEFGVTISVACFSSEGVLHFDHVLDIPSQDTNSFDMFYIFDVKALTNGGVLVTGRAEKFDDNYPYNNRSYLLYYYPAQDVNIVETHCNASLRRVFPNPAKTQFTVTNTENANLYLYNMVGQEVLHTYSTEENSIINVNFLPQGLYVLKVVKDGVVSVHKVGVSY
jgi:hypothetical protein